MGNCGDFSCCSFDRNQGSVNANIFFSQTEGALAIPFGAGTETTVLTLPVVTTQSLQPVKLDGLVQIEAAIGAALLSYQYGVRIRVRRDGNLLMTQTIRQENSLSLSLSFTQVSGVPISLVDNNTLLGTNTYTVTLEFFLRSGTNVTITAQTRSINALTI